VWGKKMLLFDQELNITCKALIIKLEGLRNQQKIEIQKLVVKNKKI
jgi:hypothetical protein